PESGARGAKKPAGPDPTTATRMVVMLIVLAGIAVFEREHHATQEPIQLFLLASGQRLGEQRFLRGLDGHCLLVPREALLRELDEDTPPVLRVAEAAHETVLLQRVEPARHRAARQVRAASEPSRLAPIRHAGPAQRREHVPVAERESKLLERLVV